MNKLLTFPFNHAIIVTVEERRLYKKKPSRWSEQQDGRKGGLEMAFILIRKDGIWYFNGIEYPNFHEALVAAWKTR